MSCSKSLKRAPGKGEGREEKNVLVSYKSMKLTEASHSKESTSPSASLRAKLRAGRGGRRGSAGSGHKGPYTSCKNTEASLHGISGKTTTPTSARPRVCLDDRGRFINSETPARDFPSGPVVKSPPPNAGDVSSIPGQGIKIPRLLAKKNIKQEQYCNKFKKDF